jgi:hypothetical protein
MVRVLPLTLYEVGFCTTLAIVTCMSFGALTSLLNVQFVDEPLPVNWSVPAIKFWVVGVEPT